MTPKIPKTPFATRLSGSAKETQLRICNIFQWKKRRPPVWLFAFIVLVIFGCIGLVSCREKEDTLWAGLNARVVEIDTEQMILYIQDIDENANVFGQRCALECKQAAQEERLIFVDYETHELTDISFYEFQVGDEIIVEMYTSQKEGAKDNTARAEQVQLGTQRPVYEMLSAAANWYGEFFANYQDKFEEYTYSGGTNFTYDDRTLVLEDVPENMVEQLLFANYSFAAAFEFEGLVGLQGSENLQLSAKNEAKNAAEGLYFENVTIHALDTLSEEDFTPGGKYFSDTKSVFEFVDRVNYLKDGHGLTEYAIVYTDLSWQWSEKALSMGPQLDNGRYERLYLVGKLYEYSNWHLYECFWGERVLGRTYSDQDTTNASVMSELFSASNVSDVTPSPEGKLLVAPTGEGQSFCAAYFTERDNYELVIGIWDSETGGLVGTPFHAANSGGTPKVVAYEWDGKKRLIYTANGMRQGYSYGQAGEIHLVDGEMTWAWPVQGDVRDVTRDSVGQPYNKYLEYWENHLALMSANGLDVFEENEEYGFYEDSPQQWSYYGTGTTYHVVSKHRLDEYDMEQVRVWLEEFCRDGNNAWNTKNASASWRILALERSELHKKCTLLCVSEYDETVYLRAVLNMDHEKDRFQREPLEVLEWEIESSTVEAILEEAASYNRRSTKRDRLIQEYMKILYPQNQIYFMESLNEEVGPGYTAITEIEPMGQAALDEDTIGAVYRVTVQMSFASMHGGTQAKFDHVVVLSCNNSMTLNGILGEVEGSDGMSLREIVQQASEGEDELEMSLWHEGDPNLVPIRLGEWNEAAFANVSGTPVVNILDGWEPIYWPGDYWDQYTREGISALRYHHADGDDFSSYTIDVTRDDFITQRGIRIGDTKEVVKTAYPELKSGDYWSKYPGEDYLWYCEDAEDFGPALIFFFENDKVSKIVLNNMFN